MGIVSKPTEQEVRRILPEVPKLPPEHGFEPDIVPRPKVSPKPTVPQEKVKSMKGETPPEPAPRTLIEDTKVDVMEITKKSKKSAKKHKSKDRNSVPLMLSRSSEVIHSEQIIPPPSST